VQIVQLAERLLAQTFEGVTENPKHPVYASAADMLANYSRGRQPRSPHSHPRRKK
jgi:hypothetical protein